MPSLSPQHQPKLHSEGDSAQLCELPEESSATRLADECSDELPMSDSTADPVSRLPFEIVTACFRLLGLRGRLAASQVSRAWRRAALADCGLWNSLRAGPTRPYGREMLETLLARSGPDTPFDFAWESATTIPDGLRDALAQNMGRMGRVTCRGASARLLQLRAPALRSLTLYDDVPVVLPADWTHRVPRLEVLELGVFSMPADFQPLAALTSFTGCLAAGSSAPPLACVFPHLVKLRLECTTQETARALGAPPPSCLSVSLIVKKSARARRQGRTRRILLL